MRPQMAEQTITSTRLYECLLAITRDHHAGLPCLRGNITLRRALCLNAAGLLIGEATFGHRASV